jgi:hypothetical protein
VVVLVELTVEELEVSTIVKKSPRSMLTAASL